MAQRRRGNATGSRVHRQAKPRDYSAERARRNASARAAGFKSADHYQRLARSKGAQGVRIREALAAAGIRRGADRYRVASLAAHLTRFEGRKRSKARARDIASLAAAIRKAGGNVSATIAAVGSPKRRGRK